MDQDSMFIKSPNLCRWKEQAESGIWDIMIGMFIFFLALNRLLQGRNSFFLFFLIIPYIGKSLRRRCIGSSTEDINTNNKTNCKQYGVLLFLLGILVIGVIGMIVASIMKQTVLDVSLLFNMIGVLVSGIVIIGGIAQKTVFYAYAICLSIPIFVLQYGYKLWFSMLILGALILLVIGFLVWILSKSTQDDQSNVPDRPVVIAHYFMMELGLLFFAYFVLNAFYPEFANWLRHIVTENTSLVIGLCISIFVTGLGIAFVIERFFLYSFIIAISVVLPKIIATEKIRAAYFLIIASIYFIVNGIFILRKYFKAHSQEINPPVQ